MIITPWKCNQLLTTGFFDIPLHSNTVIYLFIEKPLGSMCACACFQFIFHLMTSRNDTKMIYYSHPTPHVCAFNMKLRASEWIEERRHLPLLAKWPKCRVRFIPPPQRSLIDGPLPRSGQLLRIITFWKSISIWITAAFLVFTALAAQETHWPITCSNQPICFNYIQYCINISDLISSLSCINWNYSQKVV